MGISGAMFRTTPPSPRDTQTNLVLDLHPQNKKEVKLMRQRPVVLKVTVLISILIVSCSVGAKRKVEQAVDTPVNAIIREVLLL